MKFTYLAYQNLINYMRSKDYAVADYHNYLSVKKPVILRHDVDFSIEKALKFAAFENQLQVKSTYFILLCTDFYNIASKTSLEMISEIIELGHSVGLHFDEQKYYGQEYKTVPELIKTEVAIMSEIIGYDIKAVSMHRPSRKTLESNYEVDGIINSYHKNFFENFKYISDSRRLWREDIEEYIKEETFDKLHILTHPFWYDENEKNIETSIKNFVNSANSQRYFYLNDNIRDLQDIMKTSEILITENHRR